MPTALATRLMLTASGPSASRIRKAQRAMRSLVVRSLLTYTVYSSQGLVVNSHRTIPCAQIGVQVARAAAIAPQRVNAKRVPVGSRDARTRLRSDQWRELLVWLGGDGIGAGGPILRNEIHAPEMGRW